jgi:hypothetical protein
VVFSSSSSARRTKASAKATSPLFKSMEADQLRRGALKVDEKVED